MKARVTDNSQTPEEIRITPQTLSDGTVLCGLILRFLHNRTKENMMAVLGCLRDSNVFVPAQVSTDGETLETNGADNPVMFPVKHHIKFTPQLYKATDGNIYMPFYSRRENAHQKNLEGASLVNLPYIQLVEMLGNYSECSRFVIDPKLYNVILDEDLIRISTQLPSRLAQK